MIFFYESKNMVYCFLNFSKDLLNIIYVCILLLIYIYNRQLLTVIIPLHLKIKIDQLLLLVFESQCPRKTGYISMFISFQMAFTE